MTAENIKQAYKDRPFRIYRDRFVFNTRTGMFFNITQSGVTILSQVWDGHSTREIEDCLMQEFAIDRATAIRDSQQFFARLRDMRLLPPNTRNQD